LVGYCPNGIKLWDTLVKKVIVGRDVVFNELAVLTVKCDVSCNIRSNVLDHPLEAGSPPDGQSSVADPGSQKGGVSDQVVEEKEVEMNEPQLHQTLGPRRSTRKSKKPAWLYD